MSFLKWVALFPKTKEFGWLQDSVVKTQVIYSSTCLILLGLVKTLLEAASANCSIGCALYLQYQFVSSTKRLQVLRWLKVVCLDFELREKLKKKQFKKGNNRQVLYIISCGSCNNVGNNEIYKNKYSISCVYREKERESKYVTVYFFVSGTLRTKLFHANNRFTVQGCSRTSHKAIDLTQKTLSQKQ